MALKSLRNNETIIKMKKQLLFTALIIASLSTLAQIPSAGLIAHYPFSGNSLDVSGSNLNPTVNTTSLTADRFGNPNSAILLNGTNSYIEIPDNNLLDFNDSASISIWFEMIGTSSGSTRLLDKGIGNTNDGYIISAHTSGYSFIGGSIGTVPGEGASHKPLQLNQWYNVVTIFKNNIVTMYLNGQLDTTYTGTSPMTSNSSNLRIGTANPLGGYFDGKIDDIRIYKSALTAGNVTSIFNEGLCFQTVTVTDTLVINVGTLGFSPVTYSNTIKIYPNPTNSNITIDYGNYSSLSGCSIKIINSLSSIVYTAPINQQQSVVNLSTWTGNGLYFVQLIDNKGNIIDIRKIVLQ